MYFYGTRSFRIQSMGPEGSYNAQRELYVKKPMKNQFWRSNFKMGLAGAGLVQEGPWFK